MSTLSAAAAARYGGKIGSTEVGEKAEGEGRPRRFTKTQDRLVTKPWEGLETLYDVLTYAARTHGTRNAFGHRDIVDVHEEEKEVTKIVGGKEVKETKKWQFFQLSDFKYINYVQLKEITAEISGGLVALGIEKKDVVNVYAATSVNWQLISIGCTSIGVPIATAYETLGESGLQHALNEPECVAMFTNADLLKVVAGVASNVPSLRVVIYDGTADATTLEKIRNTRDGMKVMTLDELRTVGRGVSAETLNSRRPVPSDVACIMYTSGTTGAPKGAVITHANLIASLGAVYELLGHLLSTDDSYLAYLPLAHVLEYIVETVMIFVGITVGYGRIKTLMDASVRQCLGDMRALKPSILVGVPAVWETIRKGVEAKVNAGGTVKKSMFSAAFSAKKAGFPVLSEVADAVVFKQVRIVTGGRLRLALSGGAAMSQDTQTFLTTALVHIVLGYGMTETCGMCAICPPEIRRMGAVGLPMASTEIKLVDVPEAGYFSTNNPPQGEVCIRGPSVIKGYYKRDDLNNDETIFSKDGWFHTGDVAQWNSDGTLSLIDRIKNLVKLQTGEYIALERLEAIYKSCNLVLNICVHADGQAKQPMGIVLLNEQHLTPALEGLGIAKHTSLPDLCADSRVQALVLKECNALGKKNGFKQMEMLQTIVLTADEWTPESGLLTAAQKLQRRKVAERYQDQIKAVYKLG